MLARLSAVVFSLAVLLSGCGGCTQPATACEADTDCAGNKRCDPHTLRCVECLLDEQCPSGVCRPDGTCAQCATDADCGQGHVCANGTCAPGCSDVNGSCPPGLKCLPGRCVTCIVDTDCGPGRICDSSNECVPGCSETNPQCPPGQHCLLPAGSCVACRTSADCTQPGLPVCDPATHSCVGCLSNTDCAPPTPLCSQASNTCVTCVQDSDCQAGFVCQGNACVPGCNAGHPCPTGQQCDVANNRCVQCVDDSGCGGATPRCDTTKNVCVPCVPGPTDNCPPGEYCRPDDTCEQGCKTGADCPSGVCLPDHNCQSCTDDSECAAGNICEAGTCVPGCGRSPCGGSDLCCNQRCVTAATDVNNCGGCGLKCQAGEACCGGTCTPIATTANCGACGNSCGAGESCCNGACTKLGTLSNCGACGQACAPGDFCDGTTCRTPTYPNFCANPKVYVIYDGRPIDDAAANVMASTIGPNCPPNLTITYAQQTDPALVDQTTGQPLTGPGTTMVLAGGPYPNKPVKWLERTRQVTKVYYAGDGVTHFFKRRADDTVVSQMLGTACTSAEDQFIVELVTDPVNGTLGLISYGLCQWGYGTQAAAYYYANVMLPNRANYPNSWYIFRWVDTNGDSIPNAGDTFTELATGP